MRDKEKDDGGSAFPCEQHQTEDGRWNGTFDPGMSLRDWFAGQAIIGFGALAVAGDNAEQNVESFYATRAMWAYAQADAMIAERKKGQPNV